MFKKLENKYMYIFEKCQNTSGIMQKYYHFRLHRLSLKTHIQIPYTTKIGKNFSISHLGRLVINPKTIIGNNVTVGVGVVIGQENRGERKGCPVIGNNVWIGANVVIVGKINIGNDVLIAPNAYVNFDVPDHSVVIGNPGVIKKKQDATKEYLNV